MASPNAAIATLRDLLEVLVAAIVQDARAVTITAVVAPSGAIVFSLFLASSRDFGRLLGREGQTIHAIRRVMTVSAAKHGARVLVEMIDAPAGAPRQPRRSLPLVSGGAHG